MSKKVIRNYLEINSLKDLKESKNSLKEHKIEIVEPVDFELNKFFYKNIGKNHYWNDRLQWSQKEWIQYVSDKKVKTYVLKKDKNLQDILN